MGDNMKSVVQIESVEGNYFVIGKKDGTYYLKNEHTEIPNEFNVYSQEKVKKLYDDLCARIPECDEIDQPSGHENSCMRVTYEDGTQQIYKETDRGMNLCAFTLKAAMYSEFFEGALSFWRLDFISLDHLRQVCREKREDYDCFLKEVKEYVEDESMKILEEEQEDGSILLKVIYRPHGVAIGEPISLTSKGKIDKTRNILFVELMKQNGVRIVKQDEDV